MSHGGCLAHRIDRDCWDAHKFKYQQSKSGGGVHVLQVNAGQQACKIMYHPLNIFSTFLTVLFPQFSLTSFYHSQIISFQVKPLLKISEYAPLRIVCLGKWLLPTFHPLFLFREVCLWISKGSRSIIRKPGKRGANYFLLV